MPCTKGMRGCRALCGHRDLVAGYRAARASYLVESESVARGGWSARDDPDRTPPVTFRRWLEDSRVPDEWVDTAGSRD